MGASQSKKNIGFTSSAPAGNHLLLDWNVPILHGADTAGSTWHTATRVGDKIFMLGGERGPAEARHFVKTLCVLNTKTNTWTTHELNNTFPDSIAGHTASLVGSRNIYVFGGVRNDGTCQNRLLCLDTETLEWKYPRTRGTVPSPCEGHTATVVGKKIYFFGGYGTEESNFKNDVYVFDTETNIWSKLNPAGPLPSKRYYHTAGVVGTKMYIFGGWDGHKRLNDLHVLDTETETWSTISNALAPEGRAEHSCTVVCNRLVIFGGRGNNETRRILNDLHIFDTTTLTWMGPIELPNAPLPLSGHSATLVGSQIYFIGGNSRLTRADDVRTLRLANTFYQSPDTTLAAFIGDLRSLWNNKEFSDITFMVEGHEVRAHKAILSSRCPFFRSMFRTPMQESTESVITIESIRHETFVNMLEFLYTMDTSLKSEESAKELLYAANRFMIDNLQLKCENALIEFLCENNARELYELAMLFHAEQLKSAIMILYGDVIEAQLPRCYQKYQQQQQQLQELMQYQQQYQQHHESKDFECCESEFFCEHVVSDMQDVEHFIELTSIHHHHQHEQQQQQQQQQSEQHQHHQQQQQQQQSQQQITTTEQQQGFQRSTFLAMESFRGAA